VSVIIVTYEAYFNPNLFVVTVRICVSRVNLLTDFT